MFFSSPHGLLANLIALDLEFDRTWFALYQIHFPGGGGRKFGTAACGEGGACAGGAAGGRDDGGAGGRGACARGRQRRCADSGSQAIGGCQDGQLATVDGVVYWEDESSGARME
jgi:hypothetical protein